MLNKKLKNIKVFFHSLDFTQDFAILEPYKNKALIIYLNDNTIQIQLPFPNFSKDKINKFESFLDHNLKKNFPNENFKIICSIDEQIKMKIPKIKNIIPILSGKGGVGKSTVTSLLALSLNRQGYRTGILDADLYGPSINTLFKNQNSLKQNDSWVPNTLHNIHYIAIDLITKEEKPLIWRGPMIQKVLYQLLFQTQWPELDILFIDMPPGTGDAAITILQKIDIYSSIIVQTPHPLSIKEGEKTFQMIEQFQVPFAGYINNMSSFECEQCSTKNYLFPIKEELYCLGSLPFINLKPPIKHPLIMEHFKNEYTKKELQKINLKLIENISCS